MPLVQSGWFDSGFAFEMICGAAGHPRTLLGKVHIDADGNATITAAPGHKPAVFVVNGNIAARCPRACSRAVVGPVCPPAEMRRRLRDTGALTAEARKRPKPGRRKSLTPVTIGHVLDISKLRL